ncbi:MAG: alkaline phosphatase D family protein [Polyangiales bacterium]
MSLGRRDFLLGTVAATTALPLLPGCGDDDGAEDDALAALALDPATFAHGVASGDPLSDRVILWTRVSVSNTQIGVRWVVASDPQLQQVVQSGTSTATPERDFTVHVDVTGLTPGTTYYYAFAATGRGRSPTGRTRTLPTTATRARFVFTSCANYQNGFFNAYRAIAARADLDLWVHLGDYIYEYAAGVYADPALPRAHLPANEAVSLADYRTRYAQYRRDADLQEAHRQHAFIAIWDDHEFANNAYVDGAENHMPATEGDWVTRKRQAAQAFLEWMPIRVQQADPVPKIFRSFAFGELFDLIMLDTRMIARVQQASNDTPLLQNTGDPKVWVDPSRQILGTEQETWLLNTLAASRTRGAAWRMIGNQIVFTQTRSPFPNTVDANAINITFSDFWDGYQAARARVIDAILAGGISNVVFLTGDIHASFALEINADPFSPAPPSPFAVELVCPAVTSQVFEGTEYESLADSIPDILKGVNPHAKYIDVKRKGYVLVDVTAERMQAEFYYVNHKAPNDAGEVATLFTVARDTARLVPATTPSAAGIAPAPAPTS